MNDESKETESGQPPLGRYANYCEIGHNSWEVVLDFGQFYRENNQPRVHTRIIMSPTSAKVLLHTLEDSLLRYEQTFGSIDDGPESAGP
jgi:hypothetical protein